MTTYLDLDGTPVPAADLSWFEVAPCGCLVGATVVEHHDRTITTPDQAWDQFHDGDTKAKVKQDKDRGYTTRLGLRSDVQQMKSGCEHTPRWGIEASPTPVGWKWQAPNFSAKSRDRKHLVQNCEAAGSLDADGEPRRTGWGNSLCGKRGTWWAFDLGALVECSNCIKAAALLMVENEVPF